MPMTPHSHDRGVSHRSPQFAVFLGVVGLATWVLTGTVFYSIVEGWSLLDALYMTVITISTVGFREVADLSPTGQVFTMFLVLAGLLTVFYTLTRLGQSVFEGELLDFMGMRRMKNEIEALENHHIVCGFGKVGRPVAEGLQAEGLPFIVIDSNPELEGLFQNEGILYVIGDATEESALESAGLNRAQTLLALLSSDADNLYLTLAAKELNPGVKVIARAFDQAGEVRIKRGGADEVISPTRIAGLRVLQAAVNPSALEFMEIVTRQKALQLSMADIEVTDQSPFSDQTIAEAGIKGTYGVIIVAIKKRDGEMMFNPDAEQRIVPGDLLVVLGEDLDIAQLQAAT